MFRKKTPWQIVFNIDKFVTLYKTDLIALSTMYNICNWNKNRPVDGMRVSAIESHLVNTSASVLSGIIYAWKNGNKLEVFDGIHRITSAMNLDKNFQLLVQIYDTPNENIIINEFKCINQSINVPVIYMEQDNYYKRKCIENVVERFCKRHIDFMSSSRNHQRQNFNRDKIIEFISTFEIDFTLLNVNEIILKEFSGLNYEAKEYITDHKIPVPKKCDFHKFWLFYLPADYIKVRVEKSCNLNQV